MRPPINSENEEPSLLFEPFDGEGEEKGRRGTKVELKNIWFKYPARDVMVLKDLNMTANIDP
jgi:hypothetical protein